MSERDVGAGGAPPEGGGPRDPSASVAPGSGARAATPEEARLADLLSRLPVGVYAARGGPAGEILIDYASGAITRLIGQDAADFARDPSRMLALVHPDDLPGLLASAKEAFATRRTYDWEGRVRIDGDERVLRVRSEPAGDGAAHGIVEDVTDQRRAEAALRASEERYRRLADNAYDVVWTMSPDGRITYVSPAVERMRGYTPEEAMRQPIHEIHPPASAAVSLGYFTRLYALLAEGKRPEPFVGELEYHCKDGSTMWAEVQVVPRYGPAGELAEILGVSRDVSARRRAEHALRASEAGLAEAQRIAHVGSFRVDLADDTITWSREMFRIVGLEETGRRLTLGDLLDRLAPPSRAALEAAVARTTATGEPHEVPLELRLPSGEVKHVVAHGEVVRDDAGAIVEMRGTLADVTLQRRLEARLAEAQRLEAVGRLAGGVAHEFNNLLTTVLATAELLVADTPERDARRADLETILDAGRRAASLTRQLLAFGQRQALRPVALDLGRALRELEPLLRRTVGDGVEVRVDVAEGVGCVHVDPAQLEHALVGLARNARAAMRDRGTLALAADVVVVPEADAREGRPAGTYARVRVADTGPGIEAAALPHLFEPFFTTQPFGVGVGLGLATVHGIVAQSEGFIDVESADGRGTAFLVHLPSAGPAPAAERAPAIADAQPLVEMLLVVDDEPAVRSVTAKILRNLGYEVLEAADAEEALAIAGARLDAIDLLVTDVVMPGQSGPHLAAELARRKPGLAAIVVTGFGPEIVARERIVPPGAIVLHKPFSLHELSRAVRAGLESAPA